MRKSANARSGSMVFRFQRAEAPVGQNAKERAASQFELAVLWLETRASPASGAIAPSMIIIPTRLAFSTDERSAPALKADVS